MECRALWNYVDLFAAIDLSEIEFVAKLLASLPPCAHGHLRWFKKLNDLRTEAHQRLSVWFTVSLLTVCTHTHVTIALQFFSKTKIKLTDWIWHKCVTPVDYSIFSFNCSTWSLSPILEKTNHKQQHNTLPGCIQNVTQIEPSCIEIGQCDYTTSRNGTTFQAQHQFQSGPFDQRYVFDFSRIIQFLLIVYQMLLIDRYA